MIKVMNIGLFYFSATGITEIISKQIANTLKYEEHSVLIKNIITPKSREKKVDFIEFDGIFFGFPVFGGRIPIVTEQWLTKLEGKHQKCAMFFTYGGRALEWAHQATYYLLTQAQFSVVLSAEFIGRHSYNTAKGWNLAEGRPNTLDLDVAKEFALLSISRFQNDLDFEIDLSEFSYHPQKTKEIKGKWAKLYPFKNQNECRMCYLCENECPVSAFDAKLGKTNRKCCITCMHCVTICPDHVITVSNVTKSFNHFVKRLGLTKEVVNAKQSKIFTKWPP
jgi:ferredoxin/flavodoxin